MCFSAIKRRLTRRNRSIGPSYRALRRTLGVLGILLPFMTVLFGFLFARTPVLDSISMYYYSNMRDFFVGILFMVGIFLMTYKGYTLLDSLITTVSGLLALCVALFPCLNPASSALKIGIFQLPPSFSDPLHLICAASFFLLLSINSAFLFTASEGEITPEKKKRNVVYIVCGALIFACLVAVLLTYLFVPKAVMQQFRIELILETLMLMAFGVSWLVKGETLFRDRKERRSPR